MLLCGGLLLRLVYICGGLSMLLRFTVIDWLLWEIVFATAFF